MRKHFFSGLLLFFSTLLLAQSSYLDSLERVVAKQQGLQRIGTLNVLAHASLSGNPTTSKKYAQEALDLATKINSQDGMAKALDNLGHFHLLQLHFFEAEQSYLKSLSIHERAQDLDGQITSLNNLARLHLELGDVEPVDEMLKKAIEYWQVTNSKKLGGESYFLKAKWQQELGKSKEAIKNFERAIELLSGERAWREATKSAIAAGELAGDLNQPATAVNFLKNAVVWSKLDKNNTYVAVARMKLANAYLATGSLEEAESLLEEGLQTYQVENDEAGIALARTGLGYLHVKKGKKGEAQQYFKDAFDGLRDLNEQDIPAQLLEKIALGMPLAGDDHNALEAEILFHSTSLAQADNRANHFQNFQQQKFSKEKEVLESQLSEAQTQAKDASNAPHWIQLVGFALLAIMLVLSWVYALGKFEKYKKRIKSKILKINMLSDQLEAKSVECEAKTISLDMANNQIIADAADKEKFKQTSFARDRFLATMSNEMRRPLNVITGMTHLLLESKPRKDQVESLRSLQFSANNLVVFINDMLDYSEITAGKVDTADREFTVGVIFRDLEQRFSALSGKNKLPFHFFIDDRIPSRLFGDGVRMNQIFSNLLTHAFQNTSDGYVRSELMLEELTDEKVVLKFFVECTDRGIHREFLEGMFMSPKENEKFEGYDSQELSLLLTRRLVDLQHGRLTVEVEPEKKTTFQVVLPFKKSEPKEPPVTEKIAAPVDGDALSGNRVLVVEDNRINRLVVTKMLQKVGMIVTEAQNGMEALDAFESNYFDLVLMDIQMPEMDGYKTTSEIRNNPDPQKRTVPIIALTASAFLTEPEKALLFGMNDHVGKPFSPDELLEKIKLCLSPQRA